MRITLLGSKDFDSLEFHLNDSFSYLGHEVFHVDICDVINIPFRYNYFAVKMFQKYDEYLFKKTARIIIASEPELVVCTYRFINPICIQLIKNALPKVKIIHINPDQLTTLEGQQIFASPYDAYFTKDPFMVNFMKNKMKLRTFYFPEALNQRFHRKPEADRLELEKKINIDVLTFGSMYPYRANMIKILAKSGINVSLFGTMDNMETRLFPSNLNFRPEFITGNRKAELVYGSKIVFNNFHYAEIESANVKFFEIFGIGGFQLCDYKPILQEYSIVPIEKFTYKSIGNAIELINYYLEKPDLRYDISNQQYCHFVKEHNYEKRITQLFNLI
jgi:spore maturation protein CgeB